MSSDSKEAERARKRRYYWRHRDRLKAERVENQDAAIPAASRVMGVARTYADLMALLRQRREELGRSQLENDAFSGLQDGYTGKLEIGPERGGRAMGRMSTERWLRGLGLVLMVVVDQPKPAAAARTPRKRPSRARPKAR